MQTIFLKELELEQISDNNDIRTVEEDRPTAYSFPGNDNFTRVSLPINMYCDLHRKLLYNYISSEKTC